MNEGTADFFTFTMNKPNLKPGLLGFIWH